MKPRNFPSRKALRQRGVKRKSRPPHVADIKFRIGANKRSASYVERSCISPAEPEQPDLFIQQQAAGAVLREMVRIDDERAFARACGRFLLMTDHMRNP